MKRAAKIIPQTMHVVLTFQGGKRVTVEERLSYAEHVRNARKLKGILSVEAADGSLQTFCNSQ
jgi:hypothetical protein